MPNGENGTRPGHFRAGDAQPGHISQPSHSQAVHSQPGQVGQQRLTTLHAGQGAEVTTRKNAAHAANIARSNAEKRFRKRHSSERLSAAASSASRRLGSKEPLAEAGPERTNKNIFIIVGGAILVLAVLFFLVRCMTGALTSGPAEQEATQEEQQAEPTQAQAEADGSVTLGGVSYSLKQADDGTWSVVSAGGANELFTLDGTPSGIILCNGIVVVPESLADGWDVVAYMPAAGSLPTKVMGADGAAVHGSGSIVSATLQGSSVTVEDSTGATTTVPLG